jgi:hypothetical protein
MFPFIYKSKNGTALPHRKGKTEKLNLAELVFRLQLARKLFICHINLLPESHSHRNDEKG